MNEDKLAETLAKIDAGLLADEGPRNTIAADSIRRLHLRRRSRTRSIIVASFGIIAIVTTVVFRAMRDRDDSSGIGRPVPIVSNDETGSKPPDEPAKVTSKPDFELATVSNPAMNFELEMMHESIAGNLLKLARLRKTGGSPESDWRRDLDFVLKNYPGTIAAETARIEFGTGPETKTN